MEHDRRRSDRLDRRRPQHAIPHGGAAAPAMGASPHFSTQETNERLIASREAMAKLRESIIHSRHRVALMRENAVLAREHEVKTREDEVQDKETNVLAREESSVLDDPANPGATAPDVEKHDRIAALQQANEQLVITAVRLQMETDESEKIKSEMIKLARYDFLTSLPNRVQLYDRIDQAIAVAKRHPAKLAILFLDLDRFKLINDTYGHAIGDGLLQSVADRLKSSVRNTDTVSRLGGDEFVLLLSEVNEDEGLELKVEKILAVVSAPYGIAGHDLHIGATIGISIFPQDGEDSATLIRNADTAMYFGKKSGRNNYQFYVQEMGADDTERKNLEIGLQQALIRNEFVLFYQAQFDLESGRVSGAEALIRWRHPTRGILLPTDFMPIAENSGTIVPIGRWALREACEQAMRWHAAGLLFNTIDRKSVV